MQRVVIVDRFRQLAGQNPHLTDLRAYNSD